MPTPILAPPPSPSPSSLSSPSACESTIETTSKGLTEKDAIATSSSSAADTRTKQLRWPQLLRAPLVHKAACDCKRTQDERKGCEGRKNRETSENAEKGGNSEHAAESCETSEKRSRPVKRTQLRKQPRGIDPAEQLSQSRGDQGDHEPEREVQRVELINVASVWEAVRENNGQLGEEGEEFAQLEDAKREGELEVEKAAGGGLDLLSGKCFSHLFSLTSQP